MAEISTAMYRGYVITRAYGRYWVVKDGLDYSYDTEAQACRRIDAWLSAERLIILWSHPK